MKRLLFLSAVAMAWQLAACVADGSCTGSLASVSLQNRLNCFQEREEASVDHTTTGTATPSTPTSPSIVPTVLVCPSDQPNCYTDNAKWNMDLTSTTTASSPTPTSPTAVPTVLVCPSDQPNCFTDNASWARDPKSTTTISASSEAYHDPRTVSSCSAEQSNCFGDISTTAINVYPKRTSTTPLSGSSAEAYSSQPPPSGRSFASTSLERLAQNPTSRPSSSAGTSETPSSSGPGRNPNGGGASRSSGSVRLVAAVAGLLAIM